MNAKQRLAIHSLHSSASCVSAFIIPPLGAQSIYDSCIFLLYHPSLSGTPRQLQKSLSRNSNYNFPCFPSSTFWCRFPPQTQLLFLTFKLLSVAREKMWLCGPQRPLSLPISGCEFTMGSLWTTQATSHIPHVKAPPTLQALQRPANTSERRRSIIALEESRAVQGTHPPSHLRAFQERTRFLFSWHRWIQISFSLDFVP